MNVKRNLWLCWLTALAVAAAPPKIRLIPFVQDVDFPVYVTHDGTDRIFVVEQRGRIRLVENGQLQPQPYLDVGDHVKHGGECGLLGLAFHPDFAKNGRFFVNYTSIQPGVRTGESGLHTVVSEFRADPRARAVSPATEKLIMRFRQPWANHNGGQVLFGPDRMLYIGTGDGGLAADPLNSGQSLDTLLGKILRIDVDRGSPYAAPPDNPFVGRGDAHPEIWCYGMRNAWRFSFDRASGLLYCADVGQDKWEELDIIERGKNYGWNIMEGAHAFKPGGRSLDGLVPPIKEYGHDVGDCIIGGYVYRGQRFPTLAGWYVYADYDSGRIWGLKYDAGRVVEDAQLLKTTIRISSFGEDARGELYACDHYNGRVLRLVAAP